jgi:hypothetical protein
MGNAPQWEALQSQQRHLGADDGQKTGGKLSRDLGFLLVSVYTVLRCKTKLRLTCAVNFRSTTQLASAVVMTFDCHHISNP